VSFTISGQPSSSPTTSATVPHSSHRPAHLRRTAPTIPHTSDALGQHFVTAVADPRRRSCEVRLRSSLPISSTATTYENPVRANTPPMATDMTTRSVLQRAREGFGGGSNGGGQRSHGRGQWKVSVCNKTELVGAVEHNYACTAPPFSDDQRSSACFFLNF